MPRRAARARWPLGAPARECGRCGLSSTSRPRRREGPARASVVTERRAVRARRGAQAGTALSCRSRPLKKASSTGIGGGTHWVAATATMSCSGKEYQNVPSPPAHP